MSGIVFTESHEWLRYTQGILTIGLSSYAREQLGDVVYVELPEPGDDVAAGDELVVIESVKAAGDIASPVDGVVKAVNTAFTDEPEQVNELAEFDCWFVQLEVPAAPDLSAYLDAAAYEAHVGA